MIGWRSPLLFLLQQEQCFRCVLGWLLCDFPEAQVLSAVGYVQGAVEPFFHRDFLRPCCLCDLIKSVVMGNGKVVLDCALLFDAENAIELSAEKTIGDVVIENTLFFSGSSA